MQSLFLSHFIPLFILISYKLKKIPWNSHEDYKKQNKNKTP